MQYKIPLKKADYSKDFEADNEKGETMLVCKSSLYHLWAFTNRDNLTLVFSTKEHKEAYECKICEGMFLGIHYSTRWDIWTTSGDQDAFARYIFRRLKAKTLWLSLELTPKGL